MFLGNRQRRFALAAGVVLWAGIGYGHADDLLPAFTFEPGKTGAFPAWLQPVGTAADAAAASTTLSRTSFDVAAPAGTGDLLVTVVYAAGEGNALRVFLQSQGQAETIAENLEEGTGFPGTRTLLIPHSVLANGARLVFQSNAPGDAAPLLRVVWEWAGTKTLPVVRSEAASSDFLPAAVRDASLLSLSEVDGSPSASPAPQVGETETRTPLLDKPERFGPDNAPYFVAVIDRLPSGARLSGKLLGLPADREVEVRVNGERVGTFAAPVPPLSDPGYLAQAQGQDDGSSVPTLAAWRAGAVYIPGRFLKGGENEIELVPASSGTASPFALKDLVLECVYTP